MEKNTWLLPDVWGVVKAYVGHVKTYSSRGTLRWNKVLVAITLQSHVEAREWIQNALHMQHVTDAYSRFTPFFHRVKEDNREFRVLPCCLSTNRLELLLEPPVNDDETDDEVIEMDNGLMVTRPAFVDFDIKNFCAQLALDWHYTAKSIAVSCIPDDIFMRRWVRNVGGHGYGKRRIYWSAPFEQIEPEHDTTHFLFERRALWEERQQNGCQLNDTCHCLRCLEDPDHYSCETCPMKPRPLKRAKV